MEVAGPLGTPLGLAQWKRASPRGDPRPFALPRRPPCPHAARQAPDLPERADEPQALKTGIEKMQEMFNKDLEEIKKSQSIIMQ